MSKSTTNHSVIAPFVDTDRLAAETMDLMPDRFSFIPLGYPAFVASDQMSGTNLIVLPKFRFAC